MRNGPGRCCGASINPYNQPMPKKLLITALTGALTLPLFAQSTWDFRHRLELRANYRDSEQQAFRLPFVFPGGTFRSLETVDAGQHVELSVVSLQLDATYGQWFTARAKIHAIDKYRRNPTSTDRDIDADELFIRFGPNPQFLERPDATSFFLQLGKATKMERQPIRLLESYGLAANAFNRFEDTQALVGGTVGRNLYWRLQVANGNPLFFRDANALAGDNGTPGLLKTPPEQELRSGFPILYNAETESLFFQTEHLQFGQALGYRWQNDAQTSGYDVIAFHYRRDLADEANLTGTFYGGDLDLLNGPFNVGGLPISGRKKEEWGARGYFEWRGLTAIAQFTAQDVAALKRQGWEVEAGYNLPLAYGPLVSIQPAVRVSGLANDFTGDASKIPAPSTWWDWTKLDLGVRIFFRRNIDLTLERALHDIDAPREVSLDETLLTLRVRV
jgi:hypothetical protein